jgi:hypothetical protein
VQISVLLLDDGCGRHHASLQGVTKAVTEDRKCEKQVDVVGIAVKLDASIEQE